MAFSFNLHPSLKFQNGQGKYLLKKLAQKYLPTEIIERPKRGLSTPLQKWLKFDFSFLLDKFLSEEVVLKHGFVNYDAVKRLKTQFLNSSSNAYLYNRIWVLLLLHKWAEEL
ncbi:MAG: asparagine synthase-related protein [Cytophagales bacterium]